MMKELSRLLKVSKEGQLIILDIKKTDGTVVVPGKSNEAAMTYLNVFDKVNNTCKALWNKTSFEEALSTSDKKQQK